MSSRPSPSVPVSVVSAAACGSSSVSSSDTQRFKFGRMTRNVFIVEPCARTGHAMTVSMSMPQRTRCSKRGAGFRERGPHGEHAEADDGNSTASVVNTETTIVLFMASPFH